jgi:membrane dipeptidase
MVSFPDHKRYSEPTKASPADKVGYGRFDFGLSDEQEERAQELHRSSVVVDLHFQGPCSPDVWTPDLVAELDEEVGAGTSDPAAGMDAAFRFLLEKALRGDFPLYRDLYVASGATAGLAEGQLTDERHLLADALLASRIVTTFDWARRARTVADVRAAKDANEVAFWGMCWLNLLRPDDLHLVEAAHELGVMDVVELAYNRQNFIGAGCTERVDPGLSDFGRRFVERCNEVGVIVDTAHSGRQTTLDACRASRRPVVATHTGAAALHPHDRSKTDEELRAIADSGGVVGIFAIPFFLGPPDGPRATIELMLDHVDYVVGLIGWEHAAIGTDWPLALPDGILRRVFVPLAASLGFRDEHAIDAASTLEGFRDPRDLVNVTRGLVARGYQDEQIRGILGENFLRVFEDVCG